MLFDATVIPREPSRVMPGVVHLPAFFTSDEQRDIIEQARELARSVAGTPVAMRQPRVGKGRMDAWMLSLGWFWATNPYRMLQEVDGYPVPPVPENFQRIAEKVMGRAREIDKLVGETPKVETALVNFYPPGKGMGMHVDACQMRVFGTGVPETRYCCVPGSWYRGRADGVGPAVCLIRPVLLGRWPCACRSLRCGFDARC